VRAQGEQSTWAKLSAIQANCGIETTLDACMVAASRQVAERRAAGVRVRGSRGRLVAPAKRARCPSWVNMSIGAPPQPYPVLGCCLRGAAFRRAGLRAAASAVANSERACGLCGGSTLGCRAHTAGLLLNIAAVGRWAPRTGTLLSTARQTLEKVERS